MQTLPKKPVMINNPMTGLPGYDLNPTDIYTIKRVGNTITYYQNGNVLPFVSTLPDGTGSMYVYTFFQGLGTQVAQVKITLTSE